MLIVYAHEGEIVELRRLVNGSPIKDKVDWHRWSGITAKSLTEDDRARPVLNVGFCGALNQKLELGEVVLAGNVTYTEGMFAGQALGAALSFANQQGLKIVDLYTSITPVLDKAANERLAQETGADIVDMEGCEILKFAQGLSSPFAAFKIVSDRADDRARAMVAQGMNQLSETLGRVVFDFLTFYYKAA